MILVAEWRQQRNDPVNLKIDENKLSKLKNRQKKK